MRLLVFGAGAVGSVVGGFMAKAGHAVTLVGRQTHMQAIAESGLRISGIWGDHSVHKIAAKTDVADLKAGDFDLIVLAVKSYDTEDAVQTIKHLLDADTLVCSYQNGLGNAECIAEHIGWDRCIDARVIYGAWLPEPGHAEVTVTAMPATFGAYNNAVPKTRIEEIAQAMDEAGIPSCYTENIVTDLWLKVAYNCSLNPLSALLDVPYGGLLETEDTRAIMAEVIEELYRVGSAMGVSLVPETAGGYRELLFNTLIPTTAAHYASMREDFRLGRRTEIDSLNGAICRHGEEHGIPCPTNTLLTRLVRAREYGYLSHA